MYENQITMLCALNLTQCRLSTLSQLKQTKQRRTVAGMLACYFYNQDKENPKRIYYGNYRKA